jgi:hypothetical protein
MKAVISHETINCVDIPCSRTEKFLAMDDWSSNNNMFRAIFPLKKQKHTVATNCIVFHSPKFSHWFLLFYFLLPPYTFERQKQQNLTNKIDYYLFSGFFVLFFYTYSIDFSFLVSLVIWLLCVFFLSFFFFLHYWNSCFISRVQWSSVKIL